MKFLVKKQQIDCIERDKLADGQIAFVSFHFVFDNEWEGLYRVVQFMQGENTYNISLGVDGYSCKMPSELQAGCAEMSLFGYAPDDETALRATTAPIKLRIEQSGFSSSGSEVVPPTPDLYQQLIAKIDEKIASVHDGADGKDGENGASAYEIAVLNGFTGTQTEWLESLKGEKGDTGDTGAAGEDGTDGYSPTATVTKADGTVTITITDVNGTTTASMTEGADVDLSGYATKTYVENTIAGVEKNITTLGDGLSTETTNRVNANSALSDKITALETDITALQADSHTHENKDFLDNIEVYLTSRFSTLNAEIESVSETITNKYQEADALLDARITVLENSSKESTRTILFDSSNQDSIYLQYNSTTYSLSDFISDHADFLSDSALNYSISVFGWDVQTYTCSTTAVALTADSYIALRYLSGSTETGILRLVSASNEKTASEILTAAQTEGSYTDLSLQWLYSTESVTVLSSCTGITAGNYYVVWVGRSNNSHPLISEVSVW